MAYFVLFKLSGTWVVIVGSMIAGSFIVRSSIVGSIMEMPAIRKQYDGLCKLGGLWPRRSVNDLIFESPSLASEASVR